MHNAYGVRMNGRERGGEKEDSKLENARKSVLKADISYFGRKC